ncbi:MAG: c-type cytochrome [Planctomycetaceae bacterium]|nr:c-type cytochrome [Planctomycetaceae bacterium]
MRLFFGIWLLFGAISTGWGESPLPSVPDGFEIERVAGTPLVEHPMMGGFDDQGRLYIAESAGENLRSNDLLEGPPNMIRRLEDIDGDGVYDKSIIFADKMTLPMGALWYRGSLYVASPPYIWRLQDTDDDGVADVREKLAGTFGFSGNAASVHGCFLSPNGRIFWCDGRHGHTFEDETGQILSQGKAARIFSCRPDGSDLKTFCGGGMDNPVEVDFTETGEVIGSVNILYARPRVDALVHWLPDGVYPRKDQGDCIAEFDYTGSLLAPISSLGHVAVSGTTRYRSNHFGESYQDNYFISVFNTHRVVRSVLQKSGSTWTSREEDFLVSDNPDFHPTDILEDADGSLLVIDTGGWFRIGCPTSQIAKPEFKGAIYRIRKTNAPEISDPYGKSIDWQGINDEELALLMDDDRPAVRELAIDRLAQRFDQNRPEALKLGRELDWDQQSERWRRNYLWMVSRISPDVPLSPEAELKQFLGYLKDDSASVRLVTLQVLAEIYPPDGSVQPLLNLLQEESPHVQRVAAQTLEQVLLRREDLEPEKSAVITRSLLKVLEAPKVDRHLEHAVVHALLKVGETETLRAALDSPQPSMIRNALVVLSQRSETDLKPDDIFPLLTSSDRLLQEEAMRVIGEHPRWIEQTQDQLGQWLAAKELSPERASLVRGFLLTTFGQEEIQSVMRTALEREETSPSVRLFLLETLDLLPTNLLTQDWTAALQKGLESSNEVILLQTLKLIEKSTLDSFDREILALFQSSQEQPEIAMASLTAIAPRMQNVPDSVLEFLLDRLVDEDQTLSSLAAAETIVSIPKLSDSQLKQLSSAISEAPSHVLPAFQDYARTSPEYVQSAYLNSVLRHQVADRVSESNLANWLNDEVSQEVAQLLNNVNAQRASMIGERDQKLSTMLPQILNGDAEYGKRIFESRRAACSSCHRIEGEGGQIGPDLSQIGRIRTERDLLEAIVFPSNSFARGYEPYTIVTDAGRTYSGVIQSETAAEILLVTTDQRTIRILRSEIELLKQSPVSVMPQGIDQQLSTQELRDLIAYLKSRQSQPALSSK